MAVDVTTGKTSKVRRVKKAVTVVADETPIDRLMTLSIQRRQFMNAEFRLNNQLKAMERWQSGALAGKRKIVMTSAQLAVAEVVAGAVNPLLVKSRNDFRAARLPVEKEMVALVQTLPVWMWVEQQRGMGALGLACLIGATGDLSQYSGPAKVWKRMGLAVLDGERQRRIAGTTRVKTEQAIRHGFSPSRRALAFVLSESLLKQNKGEYKALYDARKAVELAKLPLDQKGVKAWAHRRAMRFMVRRFLLHLWCVWNRRPLTLESAA